MHVETQSIASVNRKDVFQNVAPKPQIAVIILSGRVLPLKPRTFPSFEIYTTVLVNAL